MKKIKILGNDWTIRQDKKISGASFDSSIRDIILGSFYPNLILDGFIHEVAEAILLEMGARYDRYVNGGNDGRLFVMNHCEFDNFSKGLTATLRPFLIKDMLKGVPNVGAKKVSTKRLTTKSKSVKGVKAKSKKEGSSLCVRNVNTAKSGLLLRAR